MLLHWTGCQRERCFWERFTGAALNPIGHAVVKIVVVKTPCPCTPVPAVWRFTIKIERIASVEEAVAVVVADQRLYLLQWLARF